MSTFKQKYTKAERIQKCKKQLGAHPDRVVIIAEKHPKSQLPNLDNPRFLCQRSYKFNMIKKMLETKVMQKAGKDTEKSKAQNSFYIYINKNIPNGQDTMEQLYQKYKDQDGFLYFQYGEMETFGA